MEIHRLYIGTSGWSYKDWVGSFYPRSQSTTFDCLGFYSDYFNSVEVNSTYYTYINPRIAESWINKVEQKDDLLFAVKLHQDFTHIKKFSNEKINSVKLILDKLNKAERLGGLLIQFPYSFMLNKENAYHVKNLIDIFSEYDKFIEVRHNSWFIERFFNFLKENKSSLCTIDQPVIGQAVDFNPVVIGENAYVRLHGRNEEAWMHSMNNFGKEQSYEQKSERYNYLYSPAEIIDIGSRIKEMFDKAKKIFIFFNNHPKGDAVANAFELISYLLGKPVQIPQTVLKSFPRLSGISPN